jgi:hypothetical protein
MRYNPFQPVPVSDVTVNVTPATSEPADARRAIVSEGGPDQWPAACALLASRYGVPDAPLVHVGKDDMAITATLRYDGSIAQCDHFDRHAPYSPAFCLLVTGSRARTEVLARRALAQSGLGGTWTWHSDSRGKYLDGPGFKLPPELQGLETAGINRDPVRFVRWQIEFNKGYGKGFTLRPFKSYGVGGQGTTLAHAADSSGVPPASLRENRAKGGIEIKFDRKPSVAVLKPLNEMWPTWKWSRYSAVWYARDNEVNRAWAQKFLENLSAGSATVPVAAAGVAPADPTRECAKCGEVCEATKIIGDQVICPVCEENMKVLAQLRTEPPPIAVVTPEVADAFGLAKLPNVVVIANHPPPGGWTAADRVPDKYRRGYVAPVSPAPEPVSPEIEPGSSVSQPGSSNPQPIIKSLPPRPGLRRPSFAK